MTTRTKKTRFGFKEILMALLLLVSAIAAGELFLGKKVETVEPQGSIAVAFTAPRYPDVVAERRDGMDEPLAYVIGQAQKSVDVAAYDFDLFRVADALIAAQKRGVTVRVVAETDNTDRAELRRLAQAGIPIVADPTDAFMHNKFVIIDRQSVWTGSWNFTNTETYRNNNNIVMLTSARLAENYTVEFEEMFVERKFGAGSPANTPYNRVELDGVLVENYFAPEEPIRQRILELVGEARSEVVFMAFTFTDAEIAKLLNRKLREGVTVRGVIEARNVNDMGSQFAALQQAGIDLLADGNPYTMHHKVIVVDGAVVIAGSYNFTRRAAETNDENVLIIHDAEIAARYLEEFARVYRQAQEGQ